MSKSQGRETLGPTLGQQNSTMTIPLVNGNNCINSVIFSLFFVQLSCFKIRFSIFISIINYFVVTFAIRVELHCICVI